MKQTLIYCCLVIATCIAHWQLTPTNVVHAQDTPRVTIAVLYPDTAAPHSVLFDALIKGVKKTLPRRSVLLRRIDDKDTASDLAAWLASGGADGVITLGRQPTRLFKATQSALPYVVGALNISPTTHPDTFGVSLSVDPQILFTTLSEVSPQTERILLVVDPSKDAWLIDAAQRASKKNNLVIVSLEASDVKSATKHLSELFKYANPKRDALWLINNTNLINEINIPIIIKESWNRNFLVFSNTLSHVEQGVLFSHYPDMEGLGVDLASLITRQLNESNLKPVVSLLRTTRRAINTRVAAHLRLNLTRADLDQYDLTFPTR